MKPALLAITMCLPGWLAAQDLRFEASVDSRTVVVGQQFQVSFTATSSQSLSLQKFTPPDLSSFVVLSGPMESSQYQWVNGRASSSLSYVFVVTVQKPGKYTIGPASVEYQGTRYTTKAIEIEVKQAAAGQQNTPAPSGQSTSLPSDLKENLFIRAETNKRRVKQGEQFIVTYRLYTRINIENYAISKAPTFEGFWAEDFDQPKSPAITTEVIEGKQYRVATLKRTALFATQSGKLSITPLEVRCAVQVRRRSSDPFDIFNDPFFSRMRTEEVDFASNSLSVTVDPLPGSPPQGYAGAVGTYTFSATIDKHEVKTGDPVTLTLTVSGTGNIKLVGLPHPVFPADIEAYEPQISEKISREGDLIQGSKTAEYLLIPRNAGERVIEPMNFVYFDLGRNTYVPVRSKRFVLTITPGRAMVSGTGISGAKEEIRLLGQDIRFLKLSPGSFIRADESETGGLLFLTALVLPPIVLIGAFAYRKRQETLMGNTVLIRSRKAGKEATRRLKSATKILARGDTEAYHAEVSRALFGYVSDKLHLSPADLTIEKVRDVLKDRSVNEETIQRVQDCIERAEFARFAPGEDTKAAREDLLDEALEAIDDLERSLNGRR